MTTNNEISLRFLEQEDYAAWLPLWKGYQTFYKTDIPEEATACTWERFHDVNEPVYAIGAFLDRKMVGMVHYLFHRSTWTTGNYCYLQDLFTNEDARGKGVGRTLIEEVYSEAEKSGASRVYWLTQEGNSVARVLYDKVATSSGFVQYRKML